MVATGVKTEHASSQLVRGVTCVGPLRVTSFCTKIVVDRARIDMGSHERDIERQCVDCGIHGEAVKIKYGPSNGQCQAKVDGTLVNDQDNHFPPPPANSEVVEKEGHVAQERRDKHQALASKRDCIQQYCVHRNMKHTKINLEGELRKGSFLIMECSGVPPKSSTANDARRSPGINTELDWRRSFVNYLLRRDILALIDTPYMILW
ncbi:hypothetical protein K503DRAFT_786880 [Rhizopogon vinicolor AM-OR11-026]|uniref:Uncharacterized protein n=1 Tax=Rhizopogon vinicolor AM-OR11-026 TaxID=1314800 RepID=A0A1B7MJZ7_9AGAM|nr:hypothetical protein K503DRAFT_786880 [Rhizopogon vinicolor AM-OR11-026]